MVIDGCYSTPYNVVSALLQGLVFGFTLYINNIAADIQSAIRFLQMIV